jgi:hypothetical protein
MPLQVVAGFFESERGRRDSGVWCPKDMLWSGKISDRINEFCITFAQVSKSYGRDLEDMEMAGKRDREVV